MSNKPNSLQLGNTYNASDQEQYYIPVDSEQLTLFDYISIPTALKTVDKITHNLDKMQAEASDQNTKYLNINVAGKEEQDVIINCSFAFDEAITNKEITELDKAITNAVINLYLNGYTQFTPVQVYKEWKHIEGKSKGSIINDNTLQEVIDCIDKLGSVKTTFDIGNLKRARGLKCKDTKLTSNWLHITKLETKVQGSIDAEGNKWHTVVYYKIHTEPVIYSYATLCTKNGTGGQIITYNKKLLDIPKFSKTDARIILIQEIIEHIELLKGNNSYKQPIITVDRLLKKVLSVEPNALKRTVLKNIKIILDHYKSIGYIEDYTENYKGRTTVSYRIIPGKQTKKLLLS